MLSAFLLFKHAALLLLSLIILLFGRPVGRRSTVLPIGPLLAYGVMTNFDGRIEGDRSGDSSKIHLLTCTCTAATLDYVLLLTVGVQVLRG